MRFGSGHGLAYLVVIEEPDCCVLAACLLSLGSGRDLASLVIIAEPEWLPQPVFRVLVCRGRHRKRSSGRHSEPSPAAADASHGCLAEFLREPIHVARLVVARGRQSVSGLC